MALIWIGLWRFKEKHKQNQIQYLATLKDLICSKSLKKNQTNEEATKSRDNG
jgi:hypothetical protein